VEVLTLLHGDWHCGYDPVAHRVAPQAGPLATQLPHAVGVAHAARLKGEDTVVMALCGTGADAARATFTRRSLRRRVHRAGVFLVQNNKYAISVPLARQSVAPSLAARASANGVPGIQVDGKRPGRAHPGAQRRGAAGPDRWRSHPGGGGHVPDPGAHQRRRRLRYRTDDEVLRWIPRDATDPAAGLPGRRGRAWTPRARPRSLPPPRRWPRACGTAWAPRPWSTRWSCSRTSRARRESAGRAARVAARRAGGRRDGDPMTATAVPTK